MTNMDPVSFIELLDDDGYKYYPPNQNDLGEGYIKFLPRSIEIYKKQDKEDYWLHTIYNENGAVMIKESIKSSEYYR